VNESELLTDLSDEDITKRVAQGKISKRSGVEELLARNLPAIWRYLLKKYSRYSLDQSLVNDVLGETAVSILENFDRYDPGKGAFLYWAFGFARNKLLEVLRKEGKENAVSAIQVDDGEEIDLLEFIDAGEPPGALFQQKQFQQEVLQAIVSLPEPDRIVFFLKSNYDLTYQELADILNNVFDEKTTPDALAQRIHRIRTRLRVALEGDR
jgi:RNA polymerase sigma-70 factor (ECF subfamily)